MSHLSTPIGVHRVKREPYDDSEIFNSVEEIINYLDIYGAHYNGQKIRLCMNGFVLDFTLQNGYAIPILPNGQELEYYKVYNESTEEYDYYIQIFYFNPNLLKKDFINDSNLLNSINDFSNHYNFNINNQIYENSNILFNRLIETDFLYLNDPNKFSILNLLPLFNQTKYQKPKDNNPIDKTETFIVKCSNLVTQNGNECNVLVKFDQIFEILVAENAGSQILTVNTSREGSGDLISYHQRRNNDSILFDFYLYNSNEENNNNSILFPIMLRSPIISNGENTYYKFDSFSLYIKCNDYVKHGMGVEYNGV